MNKKNQIIEQQKNWKEKIGKLKSSDYDGLYSIIREIGETEISGEKVTSKGMIDRIDIIRRFKNQVTVESFLDIITEQFGIREIVKRFKEDEIGTFEDEEKYETSENEQENNVEFTDQELKCIDIFEEEARRADDFIKNTDYVKDYGSVPSDVDGIIRIGTAVSFNYLRERIKRKKIFSSDEKIEKAIQVIKERIFKSFQLAQTPEDDDIQKAKIEKLDPSKFEEELGKIRNEFNISIQGDQAMNEDNNKEVLVNLREALGLIGKDNLQSIKMIVIQKNISGLIKNGEYVNLKYDLPVEEMADDLRELIVELKEKQKELKKDQKKAFAENQFVKEVSEKYSEVFANFTKQMDEQNVPFEARAKVMEIVIGANLTDEMAKTLASAKVKFEIKQHSDYPDLIEVIRKISPNELEITLGRNEKGKPSQDRLVNYLNQAIREL